MRRTSLSIVEDLARQDERVCFIGSDLGFGVMKDFPAPERLFCEGVSEQHVIGMASGLAVEGKVVYINTIAPFLTRRCYEQIYLDLCLTRAKVRLLASGGGLVYAPLGPTHLMPDDFAILRPLPHMTILAPCDAEEMRRLMPLTLDIDGPVYVRFAKGGDTVVSRAADPAIFYTIGKAVKLREGSDMLLVTTGVAAQLALDAADRLATDGISTTVLHCHTVKPLDNEAILAETSRHRLTATVEEHIRTGGLGSAVAELFCDEHVSAPLHRFALPDVFFSEHGSQDAILAKYGLTGPALASALREL